MNRSELVRGSIEKYLGQRKSPKDRVYSQRRRELAHAMDIEDVTLKGFLQASQELGLIKLAKLLGMEQFRHLRSSFPELEPVQPSEEREIQMEFEFDGVAVASEPRTVRFPMGREGRLLVTIRRLS